MASLVRKPARPFNDTLEVGGTITFTETDRNIPYTARLFPPPAGTAYVPYFGLMAFRLLSNGKFPTSATDSDGTAHVWTQARFLQRYRDRIITVNGKPPAVIPVTSTGGRGRSSTTSCDGSVPPRRRHTTRCGHRLRSSGRPTSTGSLSACTTRRATCSRFPRLPRWSLPAGP